MLSRAAFTLSLARCIDAQTDAPTPSIRPIPIITIVGAIQMLTAASASLPMPRPTNMPSVAVTAHNDSIPNNVGKRYFLNNTGISAFPKSIASRFI